MHHPEGMHSGAVSTFLDQHEWRPTAVSVHDPDTPRDQHLCRHKGTVFNSLHIIAAYDIVFINQTKCDCCYSSSYGCNGSTAVHLKLMKQDISGLRYNMTPFTIIILSFIITLLRCQHCLQRQLPPLSQYFNAHVLNFIIVDFANIRCSCKIMEGNVLHIIMHSCGICICKSVATMKPLKNIHKQSPLLSLQLACQISVLL